MFRQGQVALLEEPPKRAGNTGRISLFPEARFAPAPNRAGAYWRQVAAGYCRMQTRRVTIAGIARDVAAGLAQTIARIERLGECFAAYRVVIYENDSMDATAEMLRAWSARNGQVRVISETRHEELSRPIRCPMRAQRMADYRAHYHRAIADQCWDEDEVIVLDMDLEGGWSLDGIAHTYGHDDWDFVGSYGILYRRRGLQFNRFVHYDSWAFRTSEDFRPLPTREVNYLHWDRGDPLVPVTSCFGGLGIYRRQAFLAGAYAGPDCEHIALHRQMRACGFRRVFLNPSQITLYGRRRRRMDRFAALWRSALVSCRLAPFVAAY